MNSVEFSFLGLGILALLTGCHGINRYKTPLNPLTIFSATQIGLLTLTSGLVAINLPYSYTADDIIQTIFLSSVYLAGATLPYLIYGSLLSRLYGKVFYFFGLGSGIARRKFSSYKFFLLLIGSWLSFAGLMLLGGGGLFWLTNSREAYIEYRSGAGFFYASTQWFITFAMLYFIWYKRPNTIKLSLTILFVFLPMYFLGSKNNMLLLIIIGIVYYNYYIKNISYLIFTEIFILITFLFFSILIFQGSFSSISEGMIYFRDYFDTTCQMLSRFNEFGFRYGEGWVSSLWFYIPRALYPDKPYEYGITLIHQIIFPGAAEAGATPGMLYWSLSYLDFGIYGVIFEGLLVGMLQRACYEFYLKNRNNFFAFILAIHFSIWAIWSFAPPIFVIIISVLQSFYVRLTWLSHRKINAT